LAIPADFLVSFGDVMNDLLMILGTLIFFAIAIAYTVACDKLK
jgi:hypothetical protein